MNNSHVCVTCGVSHFGYQWPRMNWVNNNANDTSFFPFIFLCMTYNMIALNLLSVLDFIFWFPISRFINIRNVCCYCEHFGNFHGNTRWLYLGKFSTSYYLHWSPVIKSSSYFVQHFPLHFIFLNIVMRNRNQPFHSYCCTLWMIHILI